MSHPSVLLRGLADVTTVAILLALGIVAATQAHGQHPATPCPCCADGMCYPKRDTWGNYTTNWRPWPGETTGIAPTKEEQRLEGVREQLPIFVRPRPDEEELRGPARPVRPVAPEGQMEGTEEPPVGGQPLFEGLPAPGEQQAVPGEGQAPPLDDVPPDDLDLPGFGPQGALQPLPRIEEGPPSLPRGLSQALMSQQQAQTQNQTGAATPKITPSAKANVNSRPLIGGTGSTDTLYVTPVAAALDIELTNPAARHVQKTMDQDLHQAIYYEAAEAGRK